MIMHLTDNSRIQSLLCEQALTCLVLAMALSIRTMVVEPLNLSTTATTATLTDSETVPQVVDALFIDTALLVTVHGTPDTAVEIATQALTNKVNQELGLTGTDELQPEQLCFARGYCKPHHTICSIFSP